MHLLGNGFNNSGLAVTEVAAPEPGHTVQHLVAIAVIDVNMFGARKYRGRRCVA